ncbi:MAG: Spy/CpxP family protein refolding chaperone [Proteobacteria bacterium]|nr:Spy/CpxP family protein refolding chaperone [Pseudomonadota bacterium]
MKERLLQLVSMGFMVLLVGAVWAGPEYGDNEYHGMHRGHAGMMHGGHDFDRMVEHMSRLLELDDAQEQAIGNIVEAVRPEINTLRERAAANREALHALNVADTDYEVQLQKLAVENGELATQLTLLHGRVRAQVSGELTPEQQATLSERRAKMRHGSRHWRHHGEPTDDTTT